VRVLIFHGFLLHGTGSNVYNARLAEALVRGGHEVHLLCQERRPLELDWVDATGDWDGGTLVVGERRSPVRATVYRPDIGGLLPVFVADRYEGVTARPLPELGDDAIERYVAANVSAVRAVCARSEIDVALANHLVLGPAILARALAGRTIPYAVKIHGSALEYVVKPHPRFLVHAREGLDGAAAVLVGSRHTSESLWAAIDDPELPERTRLGPPGVDVGLFAPRDADGARVGLRALAARLAIAPADDTPPAGDERATGSFELDARATGRLSDSADPGQDRSPSSDAQPAHSFGLDATEAGRALAAVEPEHDRLVVFVGKLIASKGVELLLAAWPLVVREHPDARLVVVGFGGWRDGLHELAAELARGDLDAARARRAEDGRELPQLAAFLNTVDPDEYAETAGTALGERVTWTGRLDHAELADLLPAAEALVVPSTFPEAFGMVAAEGAACGALPIVAAHSGLAEVAAALAERMPPPARAWLTFEIDDRAVRHLAGGIVGWLGADPELREEVRTAIVDVTRVRWSWDGVARTVLSAAAGELAQLPRP